MAVILFVSAAALLLRQSPMRTGPAVMGLKGPPPIPSKQFVSLLSPSNLTAVLEAAAEDEVTVVKYQAPWCRTCRAMAPMLDRQAKKHGDRKLSYYSLECYRNGKASGERMHQFFVQRGATALPFVEVYRGAELVEARTVPPSGIELFSSAVGKATEAAERIREQLQRARASGSSSLRREAERVRAMLGLQSRLGLPGDVAPPPGGGTAAAVEKAAKPPLGGWDGYAAALRQKSKLRPPPRRGAPVRGGTGARDKRGLS